MPIFSQFGEIVWQRLFNIARILQTTALNISATLSSSTFTISGKFLFERCENNKGNKILVEERGGVKVRIYF